MLELFQLPLTILVRFILKFSTSDKKEQNHRKEDEQSNNNEGNDTESLLRDHRIVDDNIDRSIINITFNEVIFCLELDAEIVEL